MDGYIQGRNGNENTIDSFLLYQAEHEAESVRKIGITASGLIKHDEVRYAFITDLENFIEAQLRCIKGNHSHTEKSLALKYLQLEQEYLQKQINWIQSKQVQPAASIELSMLNGVPSYVIKSIGLVGGILQVLTGGILIAAGSSTVIGVAAGVMLFAHGINNIIENYSSLFLDNDDVIGPMTYVYGQAAHLIGYDKSYGKLVFAGMDLVLSSYALFGAKLVPDAWRLFNYIPCDYEIGFKTMSSFELAAELVPDLATIFSGTQTYFSLPDSSPEDLPQPLVPLQGY